MTCDPSTVDASDAGCVIILDIVGLQQTHLGEGLAPSVADLLVDRPSGPLEPSFLSVMIPAQTTLSTRQSPVARGDVSSGEFDRE